jgi:hypothetical protein
MNGDTTKLPGFPTDGSMGYHNMDPEDVIQAQLDLIKDALKRAGIPLANYRKYISSGEFIYDSPNNEKTARPDTKNTQNLAGNRPTSVDVESA